MYRSDVCMMARWIFVLCLLFPLLSRSAEVALQIDALPDGSFRLTSATQPFHVQVSAQGATFSDAGKDGSKDVFTLSLQQWGREGKLQAVQSSRIHAENNMVYHEYFLASQKEGMSETFSADSSGSIKQEFIVPVKPQGTGLLHVQLRANGATANTRAGGATIVLESGRYLAFDQLVVMDSGGKHIPAHLMVAKNNMLDMVVDDASAAYPLTIHPALVELSVVKTSMPAANEPEGKTATVQSSPDAKKTNPLQDDDAPHSTVKLPPEIIKAIEELRKPAPGDGEEIHHADGSVEIKLGNRYSSVPIATTGTDGKVHVDYHGEAYVTDPSTQTSPPSTEPKKEATGGSTP
jgi:hypothetical protein